jgi:hypothetical protein
VQVDFVEWPVQGDSQHVARPCERIIASKKPQLGRLDSIRRLAGPLADGLARMRASGELDAEADPYELAVGVIAALQGGYLLDVMDVMLTLMTDTALGDGAVPDASMVRPDVLYFGRPYATSASS